jgi:pyruvate,water dikinase
VGLHHFHPHFLHDHKRHSELSNLLMTSVKSIATAYYPKPVFYLPLDMPTNDFRELHGGEAHESPEINPFIGYRGSYRLLSDHLLFDQEINILKKIRDQGLTNLNLIIPFVRSVMELIEIKRHLASLGLNRHPSFKLFLSIDTPATALSLSTYLDVGLDGLSVNLDHLIPLCLGIDPNSANMSQLLNPHHPGIQYLLTHILKIAKTIPLSVNLRGYLLTKYPDILSSLIPIGLDSVTIDPANFSLIHSSLSFAESQLVKRRAT